MPSASTSDLADSFTAARATMARSWLLQPQDVNAQLEAGEHAEDPAPGAAHGTSGLHSRELAALLDQVLNASGRTERLRALWLLHVALSGALPSLEEVEDAWLALGTDGPAEVVVAALTSAPERPRSRPSQCLRGTLIDVSATARTDNDAGVPRVVRQLASAWGEPAGVHYVVWDSSGLRTLNETERARFALPTEPALPPGTWVVPWEATYVVPEVMRPEAHATAVEAMAYAGVIDLRGIVYDLASMVEPHPDATHGPFLHHLSALSRGSHVSAISTAVAADVTDYFSIFARNGRARPQVVPFSLPEETAWPEGGDELVDEIDARLRGDRAWPVVAVVSSVYRRKNHARLLTACERLWDEGLTFRLLAIEGMGSRVPSVDRAFDRLVERGRPVTLMTRVSDPMLRATYRLARVTVYVSLAEGYGLPIAESLSVRTPVIASGHGSMAEIASGGGVLTVDPRDEESIVDGLRRALTEPPLYDELAAGATARRSSRSWADYARSVGAFLGVTEAPPSDDVPSLDMHRSGRTA